MAQRDGAKQRALQAILTQFAIEIGMTAKKEKFNAAWHRLWCRIHRIRLFSEKHPCLRQKK